MPRRPRPARPTEELELDPELDLDQIRKATLPPPGPRKGLSIPTIAAALWEAYGIVSAAAEILGIARVSLHRRIAKSAKLQDALADARERLVDRAETGLVDGIHRGEQWAITLALKTLGKSRGYVERQELDGMLALVDKDPANMTDEELDEAIARATSRRRV